MRIAFIGCGAAGRPLGIRWRESGHDLGAVHARTSADEAVRALGGGVPGGLLVDADVVVFATPDDALADVAGRYQLAREQVALHLSGAHPSTILEPTGARTASLHPLCAFADVEAALAALPETYFFVEGEAVDVAERLAKDLGPNVSRISTEGKVLYHAGAALVANYSVTLLRLARDLFAEAGVASEEALGALTQLARGAVENVARVGLPAGLTGPAARGDVALIARHIAVLEGNARKVYLALLEETLPIARAKGGLSEEAEAEIRKLLGGYSSP